ncbi:MAG: hypothetical protein ACRD96_25605, partial [Bryobacteraceae bacterium]
MPRNAEGEYERVLGTRELLSVFFIVVILFGVFFTLGYIVGRHSSPAPGGETNAATVPPAPEPAVPTPQPVLVPTQPAPAATAAGEVQVVPADGRTGETPPPPKPVETASATE